MFVNFSTIASDSTTQAFDGKWESRPSSRSSSRALNFDDMSSCEDCLSLLDPALLEASARAGAILIYSVVKKRRTRVKQKEETL